MKLPPWDREKQAWDRFKAFHMLINNSAMVLFDTGELIFTAASPRPDSRGHYSSVDVEITTSKDIKGPLYAPDGQKIAIAWLYDGGQESLLVDYSTNRVVRVSDRYWGKDKPTIPGIPRRFQYGCTAYIPGPDLPPVGVGKIVAWLPFREASLTDDEKVHVQTITDTARAALKLTDHAITHTHYSNSGITAGCPLDVILKAQTWQDMADAQLGELYHNGAQRKRVEYDYLLTEQP